MPSVNDLTTFFSKRTITLDEDTLSYIAGMLDPDESVDSVEFTEAVSPFLIDNGVADDAAQSICIELLGAFCPSSDAEKSGSSAGNKLNLSMSAHDLIGVESSFVETMSGLVVEVHKDRNVAVSSEEYVKQKRKTEQRQERLKEREEKKRIADAQAAIVLERETEYTALDAKGDGAQKGSVDLHLDHINILMGAELLLSDADLKLVRGRRYGFVGRNGTGKTTLLRHLSRREIPGIPKSMSILHVAQEAQGNEKSALQCVLECDVERAQLLAEEKRLQELEEATGELQAVYERLVAIDAFSAEARARTLLSGLQFTQEMQDCPSKSLSGGWRMRISLARALFANPRPDLLMLDEPTNHLDINAVVWLSDLLSTEWNTTLLLVSHDKTFLNDVCTDIVHLQGKKLVQYRGNYDNFEKAREEREKMQLRRAEAASKHREHVQKFIDRFRYNANRAALVQSRIKHLSKLGAAPEVVQDADIVFEFPYCGEPPAGVLLQFDNVSFRYPNGDLLLKDVSFDVNMDSRFALVGPNGCGKSTMLKLLAGELEPVSGIIHRSGKIRIEIFKQHFLDQLDLSITALQHVVNVANECGKELKETDGRAHLSKFGLGEQKPLRPMRTLSGGQKTRVVLAAICIRKPHILLLDEPSNHLDMDSISALSAALSLFAGGVVMVSHDSTLIDLVCGDAEQQSIYAVENQSVRRVDGGLKAYKKELLTKFRK